MSNDGGDLERIARDESRRTDRPTDGEQQVMSHVTIVEAPGSRL